MNRNTKISRVFFYLIFSITLAFSACFIVFWIVHELRAYRYESGKIHNNYVELSKTALKKEVQSVIRYIEYRKSKVGAMLKKDLRDKVLEAHSIATWIYNKYRGKLPDSEIQDLIKGFLRSSRYNDGRGYFFAVDMTEFSAALNRESSDLSGIIEPDEKALIADMVRITRESGEGFLEYQWSKPGGEGGEFPKIAFGKLFAPYNWLIGTGEYLDVIEKDLQREILDWLNELQHTDDSYILAFTFDGVRLAYYRNEELGQNTWDYADPNGVKVVQEGINLSKMEEGGFVEYVAALRPTTGRPARKISFFMGVPDWRWAISTGAYLDDIDSYVESAQTALYRKIVKSVIYTLVVFLLITSLLLAILAYIFRRVNASFQAFFSFFDRAAEESILIDPGKVNFAEFRTLALSANRMLAQRRRAEDDMRSSESRYRAVVEDQTELICRFLPDGAIVFVNDAFRRFFGKSSQDLSGESILDHANEPDIPALKRRIASLGPGEPVGTVEHRTVSGRGKVRWLQWRYRAIFDQSGKVFEYQGVGRDITEQKRAESALFESERRFREMLEKVRLTTVMLDTEGTVIFCNDFLLEITGWSKEDVLGRNWFEVFIPEEGRDHLETLFREKMAGEGFPSYHENEICARNGERRLIAWNNTTLRDEDGKVIGATSIGEDITERIRLVTAIEQSAEAVLIADTNWKIRYVNPAFERISGYAKSELIGKSSGILRSNKRDLSFFEDVREGLSKGEVWSGRLTSMRKDGAAYEAEVTASPVRNKSGTIINYVSIHRDITHEIKLERDLRQAQKMEAIGTLAGGIAHDFNNILTAIIGYTELARFTAPENTELRTDLDHVLKAGARAKDLVKQILTFSSQTEQELKPVQLAPTVGDALKLLRSSLPTTIEIRQNMEIAPRGGVVLADPTQIHQVLMNLCTNSAHAMRSRGGVLSVGLSEVEIDACGVPECPDLKPGAYMKLMVSDTGHGMDPKTLERIFDPYFTTKKLGEGTGMGLAVVQGIVKNFGGAISVHSEPGAGTTFSSYFPKTDEAVSPVVEIMEILPCGSERILFVDDEGDLAELGKEMLETVGYQVTARTSSLMALETFRKRPRDFDLVITDMTMPSLTGVELSRELLRIRPELPIIICTGFSDMLNPDHQADTGIREVILKPYAIKHLAKTIRKVFERQARA